VGCDLERQPASCHRHHCHNYVYLFKDSKKSIRVVSDVNQRGVTYDDEDSAASKR